MAATHTKEPQRGLTFEDVWAALMENREQMKETDRRIAQQREETDKRMAQQREETDRLLKDTIKQMKETDRKFGELHNRFGELAEHLVGPSIMEKFNERGFNFTERSRDKEIWDTDKRNILTEVDILLENGDIVIAVEVKSKPKEADVEKHIRRMEILRQAANLRGDKRLFRGAIAGAIMNSGMRNSIIQNGFYLIEQSGDTVKLNIPEGFTPREW